MDNKRLSDLLEAMSTPQVLRNSKKRPSSAVRLFHPYPFVKASCHTQFEQKRNKTFFRISQDRRRHAHSASAAERGGGGGDNTPRGSWATFDLRNSQPDAPVPGLLDHVDAETVDHLNEVLRNILK